MLGVNGNSCGIPEVHRNQRNGKLPPVTFHLVGTNITKHLTAGIRSKAEVQKIGLNFRNATVSTYSGRMRIGNLRPKSVLAVDT